jgi:hypothetical protein
VDDGKWMKRAQELLYPSLGMERAWSNALQLGREMADARAEEIALLLEKEATEVVFDLPAWEVVGAKVYRLAARFARSTITKPKTREQVLEEALREIEPLTTNETWQQEAIRKSDIARRALEWKP